MITITNTEIQQIKDISRRLYQESQSTARMADAQIYFILQGLHELLLIKEVKPNFTVSPNGDRYDKNYEGQTE